MIEMLGTRHNRWTILERAGIRKCDGQVLWKCQCSCGTIKLVLGASLRSGHSKSCGCLNAELIKERSKSPHNKLPKGQAVLNSVISGYKIRCKRKEIEFSLTTSQACTLLLGNCKYCGQIPNLLKTHRECNGSILANTIDRVDSSKGYRLDNCVTSCLICNRAKSDLTHDAFIQWLDNIVKYRRVKMIHDAQDINNLALVAYKEARGEGFTGCQAVMHVIINRVGFPGFAYTLHDVIYGKNQFTSMSVASDPEFNLVPNQGDGVYNSCLELAKVILNGNDPDVTNGAHYYANLKYTTSGWFFNHVVNDSVNHPQVAVIGHHTFFK